MDEVLETFLVNGDADDSLEDITAAFDTPQADWGNDKLEASFDFGGTGGPNGNFDWHVPANVDFVLDTTSTVITGGPVGHPRSPRPS